MELTVRLHPTKTVLRQAPALLVGLAAWAAIALLVVHLSPVATAATAVFAAAVSCLVPVRTSRRLPMLVVDGAGVRFPAFGVMLGWPDVAEIRRATAEEWPTPLLLIVPTDPEAAVRQAKPQYRPGLRHILGRVGTPLSIADRTLDHTLEDIEAAVRANRPRV